MYSNKLSEGNDLAVDRYQVSGDPNLAIPTPTRVLTIDKPSSAHNGGWLAFGQDNFLYMSVGDGGGSNDDGVGHTPGMGNAQDITDNLLGKILRIDVDSTALGNYGVPATNPFVDSEGDDEIWSYGLRNSWRPSFDRLTGDLYIADVGQSSREEINFQSAASGGGENYGWRLREGTIATPTGGVGGLPPPGAIPRGSPPPQGAPDDDDVLIDQARQFAAGGDDGPACFGHRHSADRRNGRRSDHGPYPARPARSGSVISSG